MGNEREAIWWKLEYFRVKFAGYVIIRYKIERFPSECRKTIGFA